MKMTVPSEPIRIFIGFDPRETIAFHVLVHSIMRRASLPVSITPLMLSSLHRSFNRERDPKQSTDFSFTRFLVPWLCNYEGWALFMDCDMLVRADIAELWWLRDYQNAVAVVKHDHKPVENRKFLNQIQTTYPRKNWSSVMLFNNVKCKKLTLSYVKEASGLDLHGFKWVDDMEIGELPHGWNHLVGYDEPNPEAKNVHFTTGGPWFEAYKNVEFAKEWVQERADMNGWSGAYPDIPRPAVFRIQDLLKE